MRRVLLIPTLALLLLFIITFYISADPFAPPSAKPITVITLDDIKTLDPAKMSWANDIRTAMALWEGLIYYDVHDKLQPIPAAAASWDISPDKKTYTFHLRPDGRWSNGDPVTADDFLFAWTRALTPNTGADYIGLFKSITGAEEYSAAIDKKPTPEPASLGIKVLDPLTLQVQLKTPCSYFLDLLGMPVFFPLHAKSMQKFLLADPTQGYDAAFTQPPALITNGPFQLTEWRIKQFLTLKPNPHYWDAANVHCPELRIKPIADSRTALMTFQTGDADLITYPLQDFADSMLLQQRTQHKWSELHISPVFGTYYYIFNCTRKPFDDPRIRRALALSLDRDQFVHILNKGEVPLGLLVPPNAINGYNSPPQLTSDIAAARKLLADAGYPNGTGLKSIELLFNTESTHGKIAQALGQMWETNLGVHISYRGLERGSFGTARRQDHAFDVARGGWYGDYPDPTTWLDLFRSTDGNNDGKFAYAPFDALMAESDTEPDPAKRAQLLQAAEKMLLEQAPFIPLYQYADGFVYDEKKLRGAETNVRLLTQLKWIRRTAPSK